jgi:hypothetical protein
MNPVTARWAIGDDSKPKRWISGVLKNQTLQANQCVTFQIGGDVRGF